MFVVPSPLSPGITPEKVAGISEAVLRILNTRNLGYLFFGLLGVFVSQAWYSRRVVNLLVRRERVNKLTTRQVHWDLV